MEYGIGISIGKEQHDMNIQPEHIIMIIVIL